MLCGSHAGSAEFGLKPRISEKTWLSVAFDLVVVKLMGLKYEYLPVLNKISGIKKYPLYRVQEMVQICSNESDLDGKIVENMPDVPYGYFEPAEGLGVVS